VVTNAAAADPDPVAIAAQIVEETAEIEATVAIAAKADDPAAAVPSTVPPISNWRS
jgi:hypothetical protein